MLASDFLNRLVAALPVLEVLAKMTNVRIDDWLLDLAKKIAADDEAMEQLAEWLAWLPLLESTMDAKGNPEPPMPDSVKEYSIGLIGLRRALNDG